MTAAPRMAARVLFAGALLSLALPLTAGPAAADPTGSPTGPPTGSPTGSPTSPPAAAPTSPSASPTSTDTPAVAPAGTVTATIQVNCGVQIVTVTARNTTDEAVSVQVLFDGTRLVATLDVPAGDSAIADEEVPTDSVLHTVTVRRADTGATIATAEADGFCVDHVEQSIRVRSGETYRSADLCGGKLFTGPRLPLHGTVRAPALGYEYTSVAGYVGPDRFDWQCTGGDRRTGTVHVTVLPAAAAPGLAATGTDHLPVLVGAGLGLLAAGALGLRLARR